MFLKVYFKSHPPWLPLSSWGKAFPAEGSDGRSIRVTGRQQVWAWEVEVGGRRVGEGSGACVPVCYLLPGVWVLKLS